MRRAVTICFAIAVAASVCACEKPEGFDADYRKAEAKVGLGDNDGAVAAYRKLIDRYPNDPRRAGAMLRVGDLCATMLADDALAIKAYGRIIDEYPLSDTSMLARERRAHLNEKLGRMDDAIEDYSALLKHFPKNADRTRYRILLVGAYLAKRNFAQARLELKPLFDDPKTPPGVREQALFAAGESFFLEDRPANAVPYYQQLLKEFPTSKLASEAELHLATCVEEMGYLGTAREITRDAARDYPNRQVIDARLESIKERGTKPLDTGGEGLPGQRKPEASSEKAQPKK
ncbi:MAG TPA: tetratricopeptide repeat protein [bacterium]|nr:tetratricopeptide repeat protein [bacterium]